MKTPSNDTVNYTDDSCSAKRKKILDEIYDNYLDYHYYPHTGLVPDWFVRYWDLAEMCMDLFELDFPNKPQLSTEEDLQALKATIKT